MPFYPKCPATTPTSSLILDLQQKLVQKSGQEAGQVSRADVIAHIFHPIHRSILENKNIKVEKFIVDCIPSAESDELCELAKGVSRTLNRFWVAQNLLAAPKRDAKSLTALSECISLLRPMERSWLGMSLISAQESDATVLEVVARHLYFYPREGLSATAQIIITSPKTDATVLESLAVASFSHYCAPEHRCSINLGIIASPKVDERSLLTISRNLSQFTGQERKQIVFALISSPKLNSEILLEAAALPIRYEEAQQLSVIQAIIRSDKCTPEIIKALSYGILEQRKTQRLPIIKELAGSENMRPDALKSIADKLNAFPPAEQPLIAQMLMESPQADEGLADIITRKIISCETTQRPRIANLVLAFNKLGSETRRIAQTFVNPTGRAAYTFSPAM